jgi:hypothetical protein
LHDYSSGWWYTYPSEKMMDFVNWDGYSIPNMMGKSIQIPWFQSTNQQWWKFTKLVSESQLKVSMTKPHISTQCDLVSRGTPNLRPCSAIVVMLGVPALAIPTQSSKAGSPIFVASASPMFATIIPQGCLWMDHVEAPIRHPVAASDFSSGRSNGPFAVSTSLYQETRGGMEPFKATYVWRLVQACKQNCLTFAREMSAHGV